jgi:hypothetical protein
MHSKRGICPLSRSSTNNLNSRSVKKNDASARLENIKQPIELTERHLPRFRKNERTVPSQFVHAVAYVPPRGRPYDPSSLLGLRVELSFQEPFSHPRRYRTTSRNPWFLHPRLCRLPPKHWKVFKVGSRTLGIARFALPKNIRTVKGSSLERRPTHGRT